MNKNRTLIYIILAVVSLACLVSLLVIVITVLTSQRVGGRATQNPNAPELVFPSSTAPASMPSLPTVQPTVAQMPGVTAGLQPTLLAAPAGRIVFTCQLSKDSRYNEICIMNADGGNFQRLTFAEGYDHIYPSLAPDGSLAVFSSNESGGYEIYSLDWSGNQVQLTNEQLPGELGAFAPEISPDGQWIAYAVITSDSNKSIWVMDRSGQNKRWIFGSENAGAWDPSWSPDGSRILFMSDRTGSNQLHTILLDGTDLRQITDLPDLRGRNDWSPDGTTIATYIGLSWDREIILMDADGSNQRYLTNGGNNLAPSFSPDGQWVAITSYKDRYRNNNGCEIYIVRLDGSDLRRLTDNDYCDWQPRWGP